MNHNRATDVSRSKAHDESAPFIVPPSRSQPRRPVAALILEPSVAQLVYGDDGLARMAQVSDLIGEFEPSTIAAHLHHLRDVEVIFTSWGCPRLDRALLDAAPRLRAVFHAAGSIRPWITDAVWDRDILVVSAQEANAIPVADYTVGVILFSLKRGWHYVSRKFREQCYPGPAVDCAGTYEATVGLISLGAIGRLVRERLRLFDLKVLVHDPFLSAESAATLGVTLVGLDELFARSDVVSLHAPLLPATEGLITGRHLAAMKPHATFINTARGRIVRQDQLAQVLRARPDLTAVLDVLAETPPSEDDPLLSLPNVVITPHIAGSRNTECRRMGAMVLDDLQRWLAGAPLRGRIDRVAAGQLA